MWDLVPWPGIEPRPPASGAGVLTTGLSGKSPIFSSLRSHLEWLLVSEQIQVWGRGEEGSDQPKRWWNLEWPHPVTSPFWYSFLLCYVTGPGWASREDPSGCQDRWVSKGQQDQGFPGREGNWMVKGCPGEQAGGWRAGGRRGRAFASLDLWKETLFSSSGTWTSNSWATRPPRQRWEAWDEDTGEGRWQSSFLPGVMTHPSSTLTTPKFSALPHLLGGREGYQDPQASCLILLHKVWPDAWLGGTLVSVMIRRVKIIPLAVIGCCKHSVSTC